MCKDKNNKEISLGDFIFISGCLCPYTVISKTSIGIDTNGYTIPLDTLKKNYRKSSNTIGFIPIFFLEKNKIEFCSIEEYPEFCI